MARARDDLRQCTWLPRKGGRVQAMSDEQLARMDGLTPGRMFIGQPFLEFQPGQGDGTFGDWRRLDADTAARAAASQVRIVQETRIDPAHLRDFERAARAAGLSAEQATVAMRHFGREIERFTAAAQAALQQEAERLLERAWSREFFSAEHWGGTLTREGFENEMRAAAQLPPIPEGNSSASLVDNRSGTPRTVRTFDRGRDQVDAIGYAMRVRGAQADRAWVDEAPARAEAERIERNQRAHVARRSEQNEPVVLEAGAAFADEQLRARARRAAVDELLADFEPELDDEDDPDDGLVPA